MTVRCGRPSATVGQPGGRRVMAQYEIGMTPLRQKRGWIWLVVIAMAAASAAGAEDMRAQGLHAFASLVGHQDARLAMSAASHRNQHSAIPQSRAAVFHGGTRHSSLPGAWRSMLPVFFVGLLTPLILGTAPSSRTARRAPASPALAPRFQRPPPFQIG